MLGQRSPGAIHFFARFRGQTTGLYLGTCVTAPEPEHEKFKLPIMNDISGRSVPFQLIQDGEIGYIYATLNRFDGALLQSLRALESGIAVPNPSGGNPAVGNEASLTRGTFHIGVTDWQLILINEYAGTPASGIFVGGASDLPAGRMYYSCNIRKYKESTVGTRVQEVALAIEAQNTYDPVNRTFSLYTEVASNFGPVAPIT